MWKITEHKCSSSLVELNVKGIVRDLSENEWVTYSDSFEERFKELVKVIPRHNAYRPEYTYRVVKIGYKQVEVWKLTPAGDPKYKMFTLDFNQ